MDSPSERFKIFLEVIPEVIILSLYLSKKHNAIPIAISALFIPCLFLFITFAQHLVHDTVQLVVQAVTFRFKFLCQLSFHLLFS